MRLAGLGWAGVGCCSNANQYLSTIRWTWTWTSSGTSLGEARSQVSPLRQKVIIMHIPMPMCAPPCDEILRVLNRHSSVYRGKPSGGGPAHARSRGCGLRRDQGQGRQPVRDNPSHEDGCDILPRHQESAGLAYCLDWHVFPDTLLLLQAEPKALCIIIDHCNNNYF